MVDRLDDMTLFARVAEARSFTVASERLGLSRSAASRRLTDLEARLGARLLNRTTRRISLTEAGEIYLAHVQRILADVEEADQSVTTLQAAPRGLLKVAAPMSFGRAHLGSAIADFLTAYPEIEVEMDLNDRYVDLVAEGYDVAVRVGKLKDSSLVARRLCPSRLVVCASHAYLQARGVPRTPEDLTRHECLLYTNAQSNQWSFRAAPAGQPGSEETQAIRVTSRIKSNNGDVLRDAAIAGHGIVILPTFIVDEALMQRKLQPILVDWVPDMGTVNAVFPANRHLSSKVRLFVDFLAARFGPVPYWDSVLEAALRAQGVGCPTGAATPAAMIHTGG